MVRMSSAAVLEERYESFVWDTEEEDAEETRWQPPLLRLVPDQPAPTPSAETEGSNSELLDQFELLADELLADGVGVSVPQRLATHPAYVEILSLGPRVIPLLANRLATPGGRPIWLALLGSVTGLPPMLGCETISEAATAWLTLSKRGLVSD
jgi:hypothetical protein